MPGTITPIVEEFAAVEPLNGPREISREPRRIWRLDWLLLAIAAVFFALHYVHLRADFPNNSQWKDWAKYTDEGWYGDAAVRHYQLGHWNVPGDFNPAAALPAWPVLELILFKFTGVSLVAARALAVTVYGFTLLACYRLLQIWGRTGPGRFRIAPALTVLLLATSSFCFVFTRLAILEPLLVLLTVVALIAATRAGRAAAESADTDSGRGLMDPATGAWSAALGALLIACVLTKTTAIFLFPAIGWMLWAACGQRLRAFLRSAGIAGLTAAVLWGGYYGLFVRPHFRADYKYLFSANQYTGFKWNTLGHLLFDVVNDSVWIGRPLFVLSLLGIVWGLLRVLRRGPRRTPLLVTFLLWIVGYGAFLTYHANLQPRYYLVVALPMTALAALAFEWVVGWYAAGAFRASVQDREIGADRWRGGVAGLAGIAFAAAGVAYAAGRCAYHTVDYVLHPEYTWVSAANQVAAIVNREARSGHPRLVLSISGSDMSLMTGIPAICDDFGTLPLVDRVARYRPGWFATWNDVEDDKMEALAPYYRLERVAAIPAFDDPDRNLLILYRLDPLTTRGAVTRGRRKRPVWVPRSLRTPVPDSERRESVPVSESGQP